MKSSTNAPTSDKKMVKVIKNAHTAAEQRTIGDRWADHKGPRMTLAETLVYATAQQEADQIAKRLFESNAPNITMEEVMAHAAKQPKVPQTAE